MSRQLVASDDTLGRIPLDKRSVRHTPLSLTIHYTHKTLIHAPFGIIPQSHQVSGSRPGGLAVLDRTATNIDVSEYVAKTRTAVSETQHEAKRTYKFYEHNVGVQ
jgi:hypothetical protein